MSEAVLSSASTVVRKSSILGATVGPELVMLDPGQGLYFGMNEIAATIWEQIDEPIRVAELCSRLVDRYEVDSTTCERDVIEFLETLRERGLLEVRSAPDS